MFTNLKGGECECGSRVWRCLVRGCCPGALHQDLRLQLALHLHIPPVSHCVWRGWIRWVSSLKTILKCWLCPCKLMTSWRQTSGVCSMIIHNKGSHKGKKNGKWMEISIPYLDSPTPWKGHFPSLYIFSMASLSLPLSYQIRFFINIHDKTSAINAFDYLLIFFSCRARKMVWRV